MSEIRKNTIFIESGSKNGGLCEKHDVAGSCNYRTLAEDLRRAWVRSFANTHPRNPRRLRVLMAPSLSSIPSSSQHRQREGMSTPKSCSISEIEELLWICLALLHPIVNLLRHPLGHRIRALMPVRPCAARCTTAWPCLPHRVPLRWLQNRWCVCVGGGEERKVLSYIIIAFVVVVTLTLATITIAESSSSFSPSGKNVDLDLFPFLSSSLPHFGSSTVRCFLPPIPKPLECSFLRSLFLFPFTVLPFFEHSLSSSLCHPVLPSCVSHLFHVSSFPSCLVCAPCSSIAFELFLMFPPFTLLAFLCPLLSSFLLCFFHILLPCLLSFSVNHCVFLLLYTLFLVDGFCFMLSVSFSLPAPATCVFSFSSLSSSLVSSVSLLNVFILTCSSVFSPLLPHFNYPSPCVC